MESSNRPVLVTALSFVLGVIVCYTAQQRAPGTGGRGLFGFGAADRFHQATCPPPPQPGTKRRNVVFAAVGESWTPDKWSFSEQAGWDLIAVYYGNRTDWSCPECTLALHMPQAMKWQMIWALMTEAEPRWRGIWGGIRESYDYIMVSDDDLIMDACTIDIFFNSMRRHELLAAQPSNCRGDDSDNPYWSHWQLQGMELHYVNVVEVTAPGLDMQFLDKQMRPFMQNAFSGWGLPYCFSAVAGFPKKKLAAIDAACMIHPTRDPTGGKPMGVSARIRKGLIKPGSIYARFAELTPFGHPRQEQTTQWTECNYTAAAALEAREAYQTPVIHGTADSQQAGAAALRRPPARQQLTAAGALQFQYQPLRERLLLAALGLMAVAGAVAAICRWAKPPGTAAQRRLPEVAR